MMPTQAAAEYFWESVLGGRRLGVPWVSSTTKSWTWALKVMAVSVSLITLRMPSVLSPGLRVFSIVGGTIVIERKESSAKTGGKCKEQSAKSKTTNKNVEVLTDFAVRF